VPEQNTPDDGPVPIAGRDDRPAALARLPVGRHGLPREFVEENQRNRLIAAALEVFTARGYAEGSVAEVIAAAGVSRKTYYAHFTDKEGSLLATGDVVVAWLTGQATHAVRDVDGWARAVVAVVRSLTALLGEDPRLARLLTVELLRAGAPARARHEALIERLAAGLRAGRELGGCAAELPASLDCFLVEGAVSIVTRLALFGEGRTVSGLACELSELLLAPYVGGPVEAHRLVTDAGRPRR